MREIVKDSKGTMLGYIDVDSRGTRVCNAIGTLLGTTRDGQTFDHTGNKVADIECPGLLLGR